MLNHVLIAQQKEQGPLYDIKMDDLEDFKTSLKVMAEMGLDESAQESIFSILAGILHLGNVVFQESLSNHGRCILKFAFHIQNHL